MNASVGPSRMTILKEPLVHFLLLGAVIFGLYAALDDSPPPEAKNAIVISQDDARRLMAEFEATWRRPPSEVELAEIIDATIREEVYVREALALGLDRDDAVIRRRLQMKMEFLTESGAEVVTPDDATLQAHLDVNPDLFAEAPLVALEQVMLESAAPEAAAAALARLRQGEDPASLGRPTMLPFATRPSPPRVIDSIFGPDFFTAVAAFPVGSWEGPVTISPTRPPTAARPTWPPSFVSPPPRGATRPDKAEVALLPTDPFLPQLQLTIWLTAVQLQIEF